MKYLLGIAKNAVEDFFLPFTTIAPAQQIHLFLLLFCLSGGLSCSIFAN